MKTFLAILTLAFTFVTTAVLHTNNVDALSAEGSTAQVISSMQVTNNTSHQDHVTQPQQAVGNAVLQADQIERSLLTQYKNDNDLIVGTYSYGSLQDLRLTKQQAEVIANGYIPILGDQGDAPIVNKNPRTGVEYAEINGGGSGGRSITACYNPNVPRKPGENNVLVKGSMYGRSNGGYVCVDPQNIKEICTLVSETMNPCMNGSYQLDNAWLLSIGVNIASIRNQIDANKQAVSTPPPVTPTLEPTPTPELE